MLEVLINTKLSKANESFDINNLFGGIIYVESEAIDKIMYIKENNVIKNAFNDEVIIVDDVVSINNSVCLSNCFKKYFNKDSVSLFELYMGYKMFLNDSHFLETHYEDFNMKKIEVGYKFKTKIVPNDVYGCNESQDLYMGLMDIINYKDLNKKNNGKIKSKL